MRYIDTGPANDFQSRYLAGDREALDLLYLELRRMAAAILTDMRARGQITEMSHDAATNLISCYIRHPRYQLHNGNFRSRMIKECEKVVMQESLGPSGIHKDRPITKARKSELSYEQIYDNEIKLARAESDDSLSTSPSQFPPLPMGGGTATMPAANFLYGQNEDDPQLLEGLTTYFAHWPWFRPAVKSLVPYVGKRWLLDHASQLKRIFKEARHGEGTNKPSHRLRPQGKG